LSPSSNTVIFSGAELTTNTSDAMQDAMAHHSGALQTARSHVPNNNRDYYNIPRT